MPPIRQKRSVEDQLADALRRIEALELKLDPSKQTGGDGLWVVIGVGLAPNPMASFSEINIRRGGDINLKSDSGDINLQSATHDVNLYGDNDLNLGAGSNVRVDPPTSDPSVIGALWVDSGVLKVSGF